ncbi:MAG: EF-P beta-lysylation protein EpmB, partial [Planctomycetales bacterium]
YHDSSRGLADWEPALTTIAKDSSISEVILSGGDPLSLSDDRLARLSGRIAEIPQITRLRIHTRWPVMIPERVCSSLLDWLTASRPRAIVVIHANHANEIDEHVAAALRRLIDAGLTVLNQAVLLRQVNDDFAALSDLSLRLVDLGVIPYYLHQLDPVAGAAHFEVPESKGLELIARLRASLPGYAVPQYVRETPGAASKIPLT